MTFGIVTAAYIGATILFILALGGLSNQETARRGNLFGILVVPVGDGEHAYLDGGEPNWEGASGVLDENAYEPFQ